MAVINTLHRIVYEGGMPNRLMIQPSFEAVVTRSEYMGRVSEIYIRDDGWSLGASHRCVAEARKTWEREWVAQLRKQTWGWQVVDLSLGGNNGS